MNEPKKKGRPFKKVVTEEQKEFKPENVEIPLREEEIPQIIPQQVETPKIEETPKYVVERSSESGAISAKKLPTIYCGVCEYCGAGEFDHSSPQRLIKDETVVPETQMGRCKHYNGVKVRCSYCPVTADWTDNIRHRNHHVWESPWNPKELIVVCTDMNCVDKHLKRAFGGRV